MLTEVTYMLYLTEVKVLYVWPLMKDNATKNFYSGGIKRLQDVKCGFVLISIVIVLDTTVSHFYDFNHTETMVSQLAY